MTLEANLWNKNNSSWREVKDSSSVAIDVSTNHEASFSVVAGGIGNTQLADMAQSTIKGRAAGAGTGDPQDLTPAQVRTLLELVGKQTIWVPAAAMKKRSTGPSSGAFSAGSTEFDYFAFDAGTAEDATFTVAMPKSWDEGSVSFQVYWLHPATVTNFGVVWQGFVKAYSNDDAIDGASYTTIASVTDTGGTTSDLYISDESAATAVGSAAEGDLLNFIIRRLATDGSDTLAVDAYLIGVKILFTTNAVTDT